MDTIEKTIKHFNVEPWVAESMQSLDANYHRMVGADRAGYEKPTDKIYIVAAFAEKVLYAYKGFFEQGFSYADLNSILQYMRKSECYRDTTNLRYMINDCRRCHSRRVDYVNEKRNKRSCL